MDSLIQEEIDQMDQIELVVQPRSIVGKKVKKLRANGVIPLVLYGRKTETINLQGPELDVQRAIRQAAGQLITLQVEGESGPRMVLARELQRDTLSGRFLHADLYEVDLTETLQVEVPVTLVGESNMVETGQATLLQVMNSLEIECLPSDLLQVVEVDVSGLAEIGEAIYVRDLTLPDTIEVITPGDEMIVRLAAIIEEEEEEEEEVDVSVLDVEVIPRGREEEEQEEQEEQAE
jgi:large subunit ribosomal protein L25